MLTRLTRSLTAAVAVVLAAHPVGADTLEWSDPINGDFDDAARWTVTAGGGGPPPAAGDSVFLNEAGSYTITLTQDEAADFLRTTSGAASLLSDSATPRTLDLTTGGADLSVRGGGTLSVGSTSNPVIVNVGDRLEVAHGAGGGAGTLNITGAATELNVLGATTHNFGISGQVAVVNVTDNASLNFAAGSTLAIGRSGASTSDGRITIDGGSNLVVGNIDLSTLTSTAFGSLSVSGAGSTATQLSGSTLNIGSDSGGQGVLAIDDQAVVSSDESNVNATGRVTIDSGGTWNLGGLLTIDDGGEVALDAGTLDSTAGDNFDGPILNGLMIAENASTVTGGGFQSLRVGAGGVGTMEVRSGSTVTSDFGSIGLVRDSVAGDGTVLIDGVGSSWQVTGEFVGNFTVGNSAQGSLTIQNGGLALGDNVEVGNLADAVGDVTVDGAGSRFESTDVMTLGDFGTGTLLASNQAAVVVANRFTVGDEGMGTATIESSATFSTGGADIGVRDGANGLVVVDDASWVATSGINVGREGNGTLTIQNGASIESTTGAVGVAIGAGGPGDGTLNLSGGSMWTMSDRFTVGGVAIGTATIADASLVSSVGGLIGGNNSGIGDLTVTGASTMWTNSGDLTLGQGGTANLLVSDGGRVTNVNASIGVSSGVSMTASVVVEDAGSLWTSSGDLFIAGSSSSSNGNAGDLTVRNGGLVQVEGGTTIYSNGNVSVDGGTLDANGGLDNSVGGALNLTSGALNVSGGAFAPNIGGSFTVSSDFDLTLGAGATANIAGNFGISDSVSATVSIVDGAQVTSTAGLVRGGSFPSPLQPIATLAVDGAGSLWTVNGPINVGSLESQIIATAGRLQVTDGAVVTSDSGTLGVTANVAFLSDPGTPAIALVSGAGSRWSISETLTLGIRQLSIMEVSDQAVVEAATALLSQPTRLVIDGPESRLDVSGLLTANAQGGDPAVDSAGNLVNTGVFVSNGGALTAGEAVTSFRFPSANPQTSPEFGVIRVSDPGSLFSVSGLLRLGSDGINPGDANLHVSNGGRLETGSAWIGGVKMNPSVIDNSEFRRVTVSDPGSEWHNAGDLALGGDFVATAGLGEVILENEGQLTIGGALTVWDEGKITLNGGTLKLDSSQVTNDGTIALNSGKLILTDAAGYIVGSGEAFVEDLIGDTAIVLSPGKSFQVENTLTVPTGASITQIGGELVANTLANAGLVNVNGTTVTTTGGFDNDAQLVLIDATVDGPVDNAPGATITVLGSADFNGPVTGPGGFFGPGVANFNSLLSLGASPAEVAFEGSVALSESSELIIELAGTATGEFDRLLVGGDLSLGGDLRVELLDGFVPELGDVFEFAAAGDVTGEFETEQLPTLGPLLTLQLLQTADAALLVVAPTLPGDYNADGVVDAADYTVWRDSLDATGLGLAADVDLNGVVDSADYDVWRANYGATVSVPENATAVPEPAAGFLALIALSCRLGRHRR